jgi:flagellar operon protein
MDHRIHQLRHHPLSLQNSNRFKPNSEVKVDFKDVLNDAINLKISKHAKKRLEERNINISKENWMKIQEKMVEANQKGVIDSLIIMENATLIVNTKNNTVITAMDRHEATSQIFTNINGTILLEQ